MASSPGFNRIVQQDLSGGMFPSLAPELIPANGAYDITNGLLDEQNVVYRRGGSSFYGGVPAGGGVKMLWSGYLANGGQHTLMATSAGLFEVRPGESVHVAGSVAATAMMRPEVFKGLLYFPGGETYDGASIGTASKVAPFYTSAGNRLIAGEGAKISASKIEDPTFETTEFVELPTGVQITGMEGVRTACAVFTTEGIWVITGLALSLTDAEGNVQWKMDRYSASIELWGNAGIAGYSGELVVPAKDAIYLMALGVSSERSPPFKAISGPITNVYRGYVNAGYTPGVAAVYRAHYFLPILYGESVVDVLVCRLDGTDSKGHAAFPWTHMKGYGAQLTALAVTDQEAAFLGGTAGLGRVLKLSYFEPSATTTTDANGSAYPFEVTTRDILTGSLTPNQVTKIRLGYRMAGPPESKLLMYFGDTVAGGAEWGEFNWGEADWTSPSGPFQQLTGEAPEDPSGTSPYIWQTGGRGRKVRYCRLKVALKGSVSSVSLRTLELFIRADGRVI